MEEWRPVVGYEELYEVSDMGRVRSKRKNTKIIDKENYIMKQKFDNRGYLRVNLTKDKKQKALLVSRIVAMAFVENPCPEKFNVVGHDNDIKTQNMSCNLYWTDTKENNFHNGKMDRFQMHLFLHHSLNCIEIKYNSMSDAKKDGFSSEKISLCCSGKRLSHKGYYWRKANDF